MTNRAPLIWLALVLAALSIPHRAPVVDALEGSPVEGVSLEHGVGYLALAPFVGVMDYLTVLTVPQHLMVFAGIFLAFLAWRLVRRRSPRSLGGRVLVELAVLVAFVVGLAAFYAAGVLAYRPMARLVVDDPDIVVVDFHSHNRASHDGRWDFTGERNRAWHRGAGIQVAFIADHDSVSAAIRAMNRNPARAGEGTVILPGREFVYKNQHVVALGTVDPRDARGEWRPDAAAPDAPHRLDGLAERGEPGLPARWCEGWPVLIQTIPNDLGRVPVPACGPDGAGVEAIELLDGDPRGLAQGDQERERILAIADSLGLALVSASNLHGWGSTAASWNLMRIPGWQDMTPEDVGDRIVHMLRNGGPEAVRVLAYRRPATGGVERLFGLTGAVSLPAHFLASRTPLERLSWLLWGALAMTIARLHAARRAPVPARTE